MKIRSNLWKKDLIYESKYDSKLICKCNDKNPWWKPWVQERMRQEDRSSPQWVALSPNRCYAQLFGYITTLQKKFQIKIPSRLKDMIKSFKSRVSLSLQTDLHKNQQAKVLCPTVGAKNVCLKCGHTTMGHYIQDCSKMRSWMATHSSLFMECKGLQWRPSIWPSLCPCKYTMKWETIWVKERVLVSMIIEYTWKWRCKII